MRWRLLAALAVALVGVGSPAFLAAAEDDDATIARLRSWAEQAAGDSHRDAWRTAVRADQQRRLREANQRSTAEWRKLADADDWRNYRAARLAELRRSLGAWPPAPERVTVHVTGKHAGDGFIVENVLFESRPGWWVTANRYRPAESRRPGPGIILCHSHHTPKEQRELQDMGMTWARVGCVVLVPDHLGHGERRQHPYASDADYARPFRASRQDYYFRYDSSLQLALVGDSLMGWLAWDLMRGVDVLAADPQVDASRIALFGAVAGGGDPAAVAAALDERIAVAAPFNFGGPQPESRYPLPEDAETSFGYAGSGSWESTRNLPHTAAGGFLPWVIVGSLAPRGLIYGHEFSWDRERDPVWPRLQAIYAWQGAPDRLDFAAGHGLLSGQAPEASHCTHIGKVHRVRIHAALARWFGGDFSPASEYSQPLPREVLACWDDAWRQRLQPRSLGDLLAERADELVAAARRQSSDERRRERLARLGVAADRPALPQAEPPAPEKRATVALVSFVVEAEADVPLPTRLLLPAGERPRAVVVVVSQGGAADLLARRAAELAALLENHIAVALPDLRGMGITGDADRSRTSGATSRSATELMLGRPLLGAQLADLRGVLRFLRQHQATAGLPIALWGDSAARPNEPDVEVVTPHAIDGRPRQAEPGAALLALLAAQVEPDIRGVVAGGLVSDLRGVFDSPAVLLPHDAVLPGLLAAGDVADLAADLAPRPVVLLATVDAQNRRLSVEQARARLERTRSLGDHCRWLAAEASPTSALVALLRQ